ncbi:MAG: ATP-binding protein [Candidatus Helarchaeota archaeon]|nr:ATP-binding protein [Candidatus Helarchaeota archaeon]
MRETEERYRIQFEQTIDALFLADIQTGIILDCNKAAMELIGREKSEMVGQHQRILHPSGEWDGKFSKSFEQHITGESLVETKIIKKSGEIRDVAIKASAFDLKGKKVILAIFLDITDSKQAEGALMEAIKEKSDFTSTVSHELRTPLTAIKEGIAIVLDGTAGVLNAEQKDFLSLAKRNVDRLARLINDVLDFQKLEAHKMAFNIQENDINELVKEVHHTMAPLADKKSLGFALKLEEGLPRVKFDRDRIIQVLTNLVNNAIKFTEKGSIVIASSRGDNVIQVSVEDSGPGVKVEDMGRLFQQFGQLEEITERKTGGTGLGLAISKEIIEKHKGRIWAESEFGKGATFWFILPIKAKDKVLVIDDDRAMLDIIKNFLEKEGYGVTCSEKGLDAVEIIGRDKPDLVILDMKLKDASGYEIIGRFRSKKDTLRIPIIAMSGYPEELIKIEDRQEELALVSIAKPFDLQDLLSIARKLLQQRF